MHLWTTVDLDTIYLRCYITKADQGKLEKPETTSTLEIILNFTRKSNITNFKLRWALFWQLLIRHKSPEISLNSYPDSLSKLHFTTIYIHIWPYTSINEFFVSVEIFECALHEFFHMWPQLPKNCVHPFCSLRVWTQDPGWQMPFRLRRQPRRRRPSHDSVLAPDIHEVWGSEEEKQPAQVQLEESEGIKAKPKGRALRWPHQHVVGEEPRHFNLQI